MSFASVWRSWRVKVQNILDWCDFFGEMPRIEHRRHKHDVVADTLCRVYILDGEGLARLNRGHPEIVRHIREVAHAWERENEWGSLLAAAGPRTEFSRQGYGRDRSA